MENYDKLIQCIYSLKSADIKLAQTDKIYRRGILQRFCTTFELAWKVLQTVLRLHSVAEAETGSPREIIKLGFKVGFITDEQVWLDIQKDRNKAVHVYNEDDIDEIIDRIFSRYIPAFEDFANMMQTKIDEVSTEE